MERQKKSGKAGGANESSLPGLPCCRLPQEEIGSQDQRGQSNTIGGYGQGRSVGKPDQYGGKGDCGDAEGYQRPQKIGMRLHGLGRMLHG